MTTFTMYTRTVGTRDFAAVNLDAAFRLARTAWPWAEIITCKGAHT